MLRWVLVVWLLFGSSCGDDRFSISVNSSANGLPLATETFVPRVTENSLLDVLLVVDNSASMLYVQEELSTRLSDLLAFVTESDWQIAVTATDPDSCLQMIITKETPEYESVYIDTISRLGIGGAPYEQATRMAVQAMQADCQGDDWIRQHSMLAILFITDEDNVAEGFCGNIDPISKELIRRDIYDCSVDYMYDYLKTIKKPKVTAKVYGILNQNMIQNFDKQIVKMPNGSYDSILDYHSSIHRMDFSPALREISRNISTSLQSTYRLQHTPDSSNLRVIIEQTEGTVTTLDASEYEVVDRSIVITTELPENTSLVRVIYHPSAG